MKLDRKRPNVFTLTATSQELSALVAAARLALDAMRNDPRAPVAAVAALERVLADYDAEVHRLGDDGGGGT